jgi:glycosyltransferase 2 family protein
MKNKRFKTRFIAGLKSVYIFTRRVFTHPAVQIIAVLLAVSFAFYYFIDQYSSIKNYLSEIEVNSFKLLWALLLTVFATFLGCIRWWVLLTWLGVKRDCIETSKYYALSTLSKYIPGFIWQYASRTLYMENLKIPLKTIGIAIASEFLLITSVGGILSSLTFFLEPLYVNINSFILPVLAFFIFFLFVIVFFQKISGFFLSLFNQEVPAYRPKSYWMSIALIISGWLIMSLAYWFIVCAVDTQNFSFLTAIFFNSTSFTIGNILIPIPNGLIIRETILVLLGGDFYNEISMVMSSILFRLLILIAESIITLLFFALSNILRKKKSLHIDN